MSAINYPSSEKDNQNNDNFGQIKNQDTSEINQEVLPPTNANDQTISQKKKLILLPKSKLEWKVYSVGVNEVQNPHRDISYRRLHRYSKGGATLRLLITPAKVFARLIKEERDQQMRLDEMEYNKERSLEKKEHEAELLTSSPPPKEDIEHQMKNIDIQRSNFA